MLMKRTELAKLIKEAIDNQRNKSMPEAPVLVKKFFMKRTHASSPLRGRIVVLDERNTDDTQGICIYKLDTDSSVSKETITDSAYDNANETGDWKKFFKQFSISHVVEYDDAIDELVIMPIAKIIEMRQD